MTFQELTDEMMQLYAEGRHSEALEIVQKNADDFPEQSARTTFWKMCLLSLCNRPEEVLSVFQQGLNNGLWWAERQFLDSDLDAVRDLPEFKRLMAVSQKKYEGARKPIERDQTILVPDEPASGMYPLLIALHGGNGNKESNLEYWEVARQKGWLALSPQSTQPLFPGAYSWIDGEQGVDDLVLYIGKISKEYAIDPRRIIIAGFSQGGGMAIYAALSGKIKVHGFIGIGTYWADPNSLTPFAREAKSVRGYFITGAKDRTLDKIRDIQKILEENDIPFAEELHSDLGHEFPPDFESSFDKAIKFILEVQK